MYKFQFGAISLKSFWSILLINQCILCVPATFVYPSINQYCFWKWVYFLSKARSGQGRLAHLNAVTKYASPCQFYYVIPFCVNYFLYRRDNFRMSFRTSKEITRDLELGKEMKFVSSWILSIFLCLCVLRLSFCPSLWPCYCWIGNLKLINMFGWIFIFQFYCS